MQARFKAVCQRVRANNGIVEVLLTTLPFKDFQEENVLLNLRVERGQYVEGQSYWIEIQPAFPH